MALTDILFAVTGSSVGPTAGTYYIRLWGTP